MQKIEGKKLRFWYGIVFSALTVLVGLLFIVQTWLLYTSAPQSPFTRASIDKYFQPIILPVWLWILAIVGNVVLSVLYPEKEERLRGKTDIRTALDRTKKRLPLFEEYLPQIAEIEKRESKIRTIVTVLCAVLMHVAFAGCVVVLLDYLYFPWVKAEFFVAHDGVVNRILQVALFSILTFALVSVGLEWIERSFAREQKSYLSVIASAKAEGKVAPKQEKAELSAEEKAAKAKREKKMLFYTRIGVCAVGVLLFVWGIFNGGMEDVLLKAINICTQCIGLG